MIYSREIFLDQFTPVSIFAKIREFFKDELSFLFESVVNNSDGNFSYIVVGAKERIWHIDNRSFYQNEKGETLEVSENPLKFMRELYSKIDTKSYRELSRELNIGFIDGYIGYIGYDMAKEFEPTLKKSMDSLEDRLNIADLDLIRPKLTIAYSHKTSKLTLISSDISMRDKFENILKSINSTHITLPIKPAKILNSGELEFSKDEFFKMVDNSKEMIKSGDIFQILIANRFTQRAIVDAFSFYRVLRSKNPSPYLYLLNFENFSIAGSSPEVMVRLTDGQILLRPIAGTRKRGKTLKRDRELELELLEDKKELAEHLMLVDLGRNDVGRVAKTKTLKVPHLMRVEKYSHVMHLVSDVEAEIDKKYDMFDLFEATFTAGTMTGAPKIRAMELIAKFERVKRNFYSGSVGYFGFDGNMDSAITIRTSLIKSDSIIFQAGAGVVADSQNELEFLEVQNKMRANRSTLEDLANLESTNWS